VRQSAACPQRGKQSRVSDAEKMDVLLETGDEDEVALARAPSMTVTEEFLGRFVPSC
jgi:hypothetical protein